MADEIRIYKHKDGGGTIFFSRKGNKRYGEKEKIENQEMG